MATGLSHHVGDVDLGVHNLVTPLRCQSNGAQCQDKLWSVMLICSVMTREELEERMDELSRRLAETHEKKIIKELYELACELEKIAKSEK